MKIVLAHYKFYVQGGPERYMFKFIDLANKHGCEVIPFSIKYPMNNPTKYDKYFVESYADKAEFDAKSMSPLKALKKITSEFHNKEAYIKLKKLIHKEKPDLLYCLIPGGLSGDIFRAAKEEGIPIILRISDFRLICGCNILLRNKMICEKCIYGDNTALLKYKCVKKSTILSFIRKCSLDYTRKKGYYHLVDAVITPPKHTASVLAKSRFFPRNKLYINHTFIDCSERICNTIKDYVLCLGRFSPEKGFIYVVYALRYLRDIPIKIAVTGDYENCDPQLKKVIDKYNLIDKVEFVGFLQGEELERITAEALCVAAPAIWYENLPNVVLEAYSYGRPVIASNIGSLAEMVDDGKTGLLFEPKNSKQIADCIRKLYENKDYCNKLGANALIKCKTDFSPELHWKCFVEIYKKVRRG